MRMFFAIGALSLTLALASQADASDNVVKKPVKMIGKAKVVTPGSDRMLNPQPLPPRYLSSFSIWNRLSSVTLNPQPLPPGPPDPDALRRAVKIAPLAIR